MITLAINQVDWQGFLVVMGVLAYVVIIAHFMDRDEHYRPTMRHLVDETLSVPVIDPAKSTRSGCGRSTSDTLTLVPEADDDLVTCTVCSGEGAVMLHFAADDEWESRECDFCSGTGVVGGDA